MNRRGFLQSISGFVAALGLPKLAPISFGHTPGGVKEIAIREVLTEKVIDPRAAYRVMGIAMNPASKAGDLVEVNFMDGAYPYSAVRVQAGAEIQQGEPLSIDERGRVVPAKSVPGEVIGSIGHGAEDDEDEDFERDDDFDEDGDDEGDDFDRQESEFDDDEDDFDDEADDEF